MNLEFNKFFHALPIGVQDQILDQIYEGLMWRGWDNAPDILLRPPANTVAQKSILKIADILKANGILVSDYT